MRILKVIIMMFVFLPIWGCSSKVDKIYKKDGTTIIRSHVYIYDFHVGYRIGKIIRRINKSQIDSVVRFQYNTETQDTIKTRLY